jgi:hypothetical protein
VTITCAIAALIPLISALESAASAYALTGRLVLLTPVQPYEGINHAQGVVCSAYRHCVQWILERRSGAILSSAALVRNHVVARDRAVQSVQFKGEINEAKAPREVLLPLAS